MKLHCCKCLQIAPRGAVPHLHPPSCHGQTQAGLPQARFTPTLPPSLPSSPPLFLLSSPLQLLLRLLVYTARTPNEGMHRGSAQSPAQAQVHVWSVPTRTRIRVLGIGRSKALDQRLLPLSLCPSLRKCANRRAHSSRREDISDHAS